MKSMKINSSGCVNSLKVNSHIMAAAQSHNVRKYLFENIYSEREQKSMLSISIFKINFQISLNPMRQKNPQHF